MEFKHTPIMLSECLEALNIKKDGIYVDGTLGGAGHSQEILKRLNENGLLIGIDKDDDALKVSGERLSKIANNFKTVKSDFKNMIEVLDNLNINKIDGVLLDLGVSSYQLDNGERGFSYRFDAPLDMRMDTTKNFSAYNVVNEYSEQELTRIFYEYGEENWSKKIAQNICLKREEKPIETTFELVDIIKNTIPLKKQFEGGHPAKRIFQAIRIEVNNELKNLDTVLKNVAHRLNKGGRIAVITFHSLEDRIVKNAFKDLSTGCICPKYFPVCTCNHKQVGKLVNNKPIIPSLSEQQENTRSQSAKLRVFEKI